MSCVNASEQHGMNWTNESSTLQSGSGARVFMHVSTVYYKKLQNIISRVLVIMGHRVYRYRIEFEKSISTHH